MIRSTRTIISALVCLAATFPVFAGEKEDATKLVSEASAMVTKDKALAISEIAKPAGKFVKGEVYVFAYDLDGVMIAHPMNPKLIGKALLDVPDASGKMFRKEIIDGVKAKGSVTVDYKYKNPKTLAIEDKATHCEKVADLVVCAGFYK